ncbi:MULTISPECIES: bifunctional diaminohydroxyphosphoribosylaminopyrimidine deaminase/5-amino-6-(5-phosphoribosylamino)uracil reductase RibD [Pedobacter]|uniref:bifunctional diaminohydroxyphosphoribosylaminopyrimidine deaminase/5-amino-6-(5-phosphoribosylamino)uracil reductase RibD n=1 Tax=Pedobacter TaxID=84567 RepID=UPI00210C0DE2|nr:MULTISPECIES: bifunctional diaminohydroxyphosphoribosylaminopyrimidine deaminase/5-amino-6-(5-phosphoribosylamino)uracil reductase RibD [unclassified Pedobacter]
MTKELYMRRCLELAEMGIGNVSPNPMVGCVIVHNDTIIGEGYHARFGEAHAEVNAINDVFRLHGEHAPQLLREATLYVNLEPCAHHGKTPPCADLLVKHQIKEVIIGNKDPFADVNGKGIARLRDAGIAVETGLLEQECSQLNRRFFTRITQHRPYIILKWATTANGYFAPKNTLQEWISGPLAKKLVHKWRTEEDAILIGKRTAMADNPLLTTREWTGKNPVRILIDRQLQVSTSSHLFNDQSKTLILNEVKTKTENNICYIQMEDMQNYLPQKIAFQLYLMDIQSVIIEGGANTLCQFIKAGLWDEARVFTSATSWQEGVRSPQVNGFIAEQLDIHNDRLTIYQNQLNAVPFH